MTTDPNSFIATLRAIVSERYEKDSSPLLLSDLGHTLQQRGLWPSPEAQGKSLLRMIEEARDPSLLIVRDKDSPAYVAVTTEASKEIVERFIARRSRTISTVPDLSALPRSVLLAFCVRQESGKGVYLSKTRPFKYRVGEPDPAERDQFLFIEERYRRPGLKMTEVTELSAADRLDLQAKIAGWSRDNSVQLEAFYSASEKKFTNALERLIAAQPRNIADKIVIPGDIALLLSRTSRHEE